MKGALKIAGAFVAFLFLSVGLLTMYIATHEHQLPNSLFMGTVGAILCSGGLTYLWAVRGPH
jgi:hypothetical protein